MDTPFLLNPYQMESTEVIRCNTMSSPQPDRWFCTHEFEASPHYISLYPADPANPTDGKENGYAIKQARSAVHEWQLYQHIGPHPNVVQAIRFDECNGLVMERIGDGLTLGTYSIRSYQRKAMSVPHVLELMKQITAAVSHLHQKRVLHHDIDSSNVVVELDSDGIPTRLVLIDLDYSEIVDEYGNGKESHRGAGHRDTAPEQEDDTLPVTLQFDIYGLGRILRALSMMTMDRAIRYAQNNITNFSIIMERTIIKLCMERDPTQRPTADLVMRMLQLISPTDEFLSIIREM
jgi:serine/threonine protein kinase